MKCYFVILFCFLFSAAMAQNPLNRQKVSVNFKNEKLSDALIKIASLSNRNISFSDSIVSNKVITINYKDLSVEEILFDLSKRLNISATFGSDSSLIIIPNPSIYKGNLVSFLYDHESKEPLQSVTFFIPDLQLGSASDSTGKIILPNIPAGLYRYKIRSLGYQSLTGILGIRPETDNYFLFQLNQSDIEFPEVLIISPLSEMKNLGFDFKPIETKDLQKPLNYFSDIFKSVQAIPGIQGDEYSAGFNIRGGNPDETLVMLDGLELYSPFHFDDFFRIASIIEPSSIENSEIIRGGFPTQFGNKMSGVFQLNSLFSTANSWKLSVSNSSAAGHIFRNHQNWKFLVSAKYADERAIYNDAYDSQNLVPQYWSIYSKVIYKADDDWNFSFHCLHSGDLLKVSRTDKIWTPNFNGFKSSNLFWTNWNQSAIENLEFCTTVFWQHISNSTDFDYKNDLTPNNYDRRIFDIPGINVSLKWNLNKTNVLNTGIQIHYFILSNQFYESRYGNNISEFDSVRINDTKRYLLVSSFIQNNYYLNNEITVQLGFRFDRVTYSSQFIFDPRAYLFFRPSENILLKAGAGIYSQFQPVADFDLALNKTDYLKPERSMQFNAELDQQLPFQIHYNISPYFKNYFEMNDDLIYSFDERYHLFNPPENQPDITGGKSYGIDFLIKQDQEVFSWQINYGFNKSKLSSSNEIYTRSFEMNHKTDIIFEFNLPENWTFNFFYRHQSGTPFANQINPRLQPELYPQAFFVDYGKRNDEFTSPVEFLKLKLAKSVELKFAKAEFYFGFYNLLDYKPNSFTHTVTKEHKSVTIYINQKFAVPRLAFFGVEFSNL